ncbi:hydrophobin family protein [Streptomyces afghaniensis]|uniref:hydrophobin family protein n=1 Tax=Streptomyces afghaniensis TaxID=66865 RepID=UPI0027D8B976|nr:hydrophobin family protein [Streptomyces afghaniensis]
MKKTARRLVGLVATATLALALPLVCAAPAQAATTTPMRCKTVASASQNPISSLLGLLGIVVGDITAPVGLDCEPAVNGDPDVNLCATTVFFNGLVAVGRQPEGHACP